MIHGQTVVARSEYATNPARGPEEVLADAGRHAETLCRQSGLRPRGIGIALPVFFAAGDGARPSFAPNLPGWQNHDLEPLFRKVFPWPVAVENDVRAATLAEARYGEARMRQNFLYVSVGTGMAVGIVAGGRILVGAHSNAGQIGHTVLDRSHQDWLCGCGQNGHVESMVAGPSILRRYQQGSNVSAGVETSEQVVALAEAGDAWARPCLDDAIEAFSLTLLNLINLLDPEVVVFGGGMGIVYWRYRDRIASFLHERAITAATRQVLLMSSRIVDAGLLGAGMLLEPEAEAMLPGLLRFNLERSTAPK